MESTKVSACLAAVGAGAAATGDAVPTTSVAGSAVNAARIAAARPLPRMPISPCLPVVCLLGDRRAERGAEAGNVRGAGYEASEFRAKVGLVTRPDRVSNGIL